MRALEVNWSALPGKAARLGQTKYKRHQYGDDKLREPILTGKVGGIIYGIVAGYLAIKVSLPLGLIVGALCARRLHLSEPRYVMPVAEVRTAVAKKLETVIEPVETDALRATLSVLQNSEGWALQAIYSSGEISMSQYKTKASAVRRGTVMADELEAAGYRVKINA